MSVDRPLFLGGKLRETGDLLPILNPATGEEIARVHRAGEGEIEDALLAAREGFEEIRRLPGHRRAEILHRTSRMIEENRERFGTIIAEEAGKPIKAALGEVDRAVFTFRVAAEEAPRRIGEVIPMDWVPWGEGVEGIVKRFPIGPVVGITPFNFPLNLVAHKLAPAFAVGCSVILKPSSSTPLTALKLAELLYEAGLPPAALSVLPMSSRYAPLLVADPRPAMVTFTGSPAVGWPLKGLAGKKRVTLELGGNAAVIVHADADVERAVAKCVVGGYGYAGQSCISVQRIVIHESIYETFREAFVARVKSLKVGNPLDEATDVGPLITEEAAVKVERRVDEAVGRGAVILTGGKREGLFYEPTVVEKVDTDLDLYREEIFGPVTMLHPYATFDEAIGMVNDSAYGLQAGLFTRDYALVQKAFDALEVGGVVLNNASAFRIDHQPYGGIKDSGFGREGLVYAMEEMTERKILLTALP